MFATKRGFLTLWWLDGAEVSASGWGSGGPRFQSHPRLTFQSCSRYQLNQLGSKAASESTFKKSNTCGVSNNKLYFFTFYFFVVFLNSRCESVSLETDDFQNNQAERGSTRDVIQYSHSDSLHKINARIFFFNKSRCFRCKTTACLFNIR